MIEQPTTRSESNPTFRALFDCANIAVIVVDKDGVISMINPHFERLFGYSGDDLSGKRIKKLIPDRYREASQLYLTNFMDNPYPQPMDVDDSLKIHAIHNDGTEIPVEISPGYHETDGEEYVVCYINDVSDSMQIERKLELYTEDLEKAVVERTEQLIDSLEKEKQLNELKSRFVSMASHEIRTPLSAIRTSASLIGRYESTEEQHKRDKHIERIKSSVKNLVGILDDFLSLDKLETGKILVEENTVNIVEMVQEIIEETKSISMTGQNVNYTHKGPDDLIVDVNILQHIIQNLVSNGIKYSDRDVDLEISSDGQDLSILVRDYGIGIPSEEHDQMYSLFFRANNTSGYQGTGLGLNIVKRYVDLLDGTIHFTSQVDSGTEFIVNLPLGKEL